MGFPPLFSDIAERCYGFGSIEHLNANGCRLRLSFSVISFKCRLWATASKRLKRTGEDFIHDSPVRIANENDSH